MPCCRSTMSRLPGERWRGGDNGIAHPERVAVTAIALAAAWVAARMHGEIVAGDPTREFAGVSIDTRTLNANDLFVAIRGDRFDGAACAAGAIDAGAAGVVVPRGWVAKGGGTAPGVSSS